MQNETTTTAEPLCSLKRLLQSLDFLGEVLLLPLTVCPHTEAQSLALSSECIYAQTDCASSRVNLRTSSAIMLHSAIFEPP